MLTHDFFDRDSCVVARELLGKVIRRRLDSVWLAAQIIETEAYYKNEKGSHASLGRSPSREAMFMAPGTIYMYYARGRDSLNVSTAGQGNAVLIKAARPFVDAQSPAENITLMQQQFKDQGVRRKVERLCSGQTLLCQALSLQVKRWNTAQFDRQEFYLEPVSNGLEAYIQAPRLGIPVGRDEGLMYRFIDYRYAALCTRNPVKVRRWQEGVDYIIYPGDFCSISVHVDRDSN